MKEIREIARKYLNVCENDINHKQLVNEWNKLYGNSHNLYMGYSYPWCAMFSSLMCLKAGFTDADVPLSTGTLSLIKKAKALNLWVENDNYIPQPNDLILYEWSDDANFVVTDCVNDADHVGIVDSINTDCFYVIEGNYSHKVGIRKVPINGRYIRGFIQISKLYNNVNNSITNINNENYINCAKEVINGKYGNGATRKNKLLAKGYTIEEIEKIQNIVNEMLK